MNAATTIRPQPDTALRRRALRIIVFVFLNCIVVNLLLPVVFKQPSSLTYTAAFAQRQAQDDSWMLMHRVLQYLEYPEIRQSFSGQPLYTALFFGRHVKFIYPLTSLLFVEPFIRVNSLTSEHYVVLNTISWAFVLLTTGLVARLYLRLRAQAPGIAAERPSEKYLHALPAIIAGLTFYPLLRGYVLGQIQVWLDALFAAAALAWCCRRKSLAGALCGIMAVIKPQFGLLLLWGIVRREKRFTVALLGTSLLFVLVSILKYGLDNNLDYPGVLSYISKHGEAYYPNQSVNGFLNRLLFNGVNLEWREFEYAPFHPVVFWGTTVSSMALLGAALFWMKGRMKEAPLLDFLVISLSITIAAPIAWEHHYGILLPMYFAALAAALATPGLPARYYLLLGCSFFLTSNVFDGTNAFADSPLNVLQSYVLAGALLFLVLLYRLRNLGLPPAHPSVADPGRRPS